MSFVRHCPSWAEVRIMAKEEPAVRGMSFVRHCPSRSAAPPGVAAPGGPARPLTCFRIHRLLGRELRRAGGCRLPPGTSRWGRCCWRRRRRLRGPARAAATPGGPRGRRCPSSSRTPLLRGAACGVPFHSAPGPGRFGPLRAQARPFLARGPSQRPRPRRPPPGEQEGAGSRWTVRARRSRLPLARLERGVRGLASFPVGALPRSLLRACGGREGPR